MAEQLDDKLNRKDEAKFLINYLTKRYEIKGNEPFVLNVNAKWGYGKTFFLKLLKDRLEDENRNHEVIYFDAWKNDFTKDPLLAFFSEINNSLEHYLLDCNDETKKELKSMFKSSLPLFLSIMSKHLTGYTLDQLKNLSDEDDNQSNENTKKDLSSIISKTTELALKEHNTTKKSIKQFKINMGKLLELIDITKKLPLYILIDELDRCRPNYAIELLENIKHIFDIKDIYFIIATNSKQLSHSINAIYGSNFSSEIYLKRFFDQEYNLKEPNKYEYIRFLYEKEIHNKDLIYTPIINSNKDEKIFTIEYYSKFFKLSLRDIKQILDILSTILLTWEIEEEIHLPYMLYFIITKYKYNDLFNKSKENLDAQIIRTIFPKYEFDITKFNNISIPNLILIYSKILDCNVEDIYEREDKIYKLLNNKRNEEYKTIVPFNQDNTKIRKLTEYPNIVESAAQLK